VLNSCGFGVLCGLGFVGWSGDPDAVEDLRCNCGAEAVWVLLAGRGVDTSAVRGLVVAVNRWTQLTLMRKAKSSERLDCGSSR